MKDVNRKIQCVKVTRPETHGKQSCTYRLSTFSVTDEFDGAEVGEKITLELTEMKPAEYEALEDFSGW